MNPIITVAIDGPAGAGKSTVAKIIAKKLGFSFLDTGAMYRSLTLKAMRQAVALDDEKSLAQLAVETSIDLTGDEDGAQKVFLDGEDVTAEIRTPDVTNNTFYIARAASVRAIMVRKQQVIGRAKSVVAEGRDIGTVVFPKADYKFYLDADMAERTRRRLLELKEKGRNVDEQELSQEMKERDNKDMTRDVGPLKRADDAIVINSTALSIDEVVETILGHIQIPEQSR